MLKKISYTIDCQGKNYISRDFGEKNSYPNQITHSPPTFLKSQWSTPKDKIEGLWTVYHCPGMYEFEYVV